MCVYGLIRYACGASTNHWLRCPDARYDTRPFDNSNDDNLLSTLCNNIGTGPFMNAPSATGCGYSRCTRPQCRDWLNTQQVLISERRNELYLENQRQKRLPKYPEELRREESQIAAEEELDKVFLQPFRDYLKTQRSQPQRAADGKGAEHLRDAAFAQALRSRFGLQRSGFRVWAAIDDPAIEKYCYTQGGKRHTLEGFRVVPAGADQQQLAAEQGGTQPRGPQGGEEAHQEPVEPEIRTVVRRKKGAKVSQMGETSAANDRVQDWLDRDRRGPPGYR